MTAERAQRIRFRGTFSNSSIAAPALEMAGDAALVERGVLRMLLMRCPCGCGDDLVLNLDQRAGPAWRCYRRSGRLTVHPSYWRDTACGSHFILWNDEIFWCDWQDEERWWASQGGLEEQVANCLGSEWRTYESVAEHLDELPWDVLRACYSLVRLRKAEAHPDRKAGRFRRLALD